MLVLALETPGSLETLSCRLLLAALIMGKTVQEMDVKNQNGTKYRDTNIFQFFFHFHSTQEIFI